MEYVVGCGVEGEEAGEGVEEDGDEDGEGEGEDEGEEEDGRGGSELMVVRWRCR